MLETHLYPRFVERRLTESTVAAGESETLEFKHYRDARRSISCTKTRRP